MGTWRVVTPWGDFKPAVHVASGAASGTASQVSERVWFFAEAAILAGDPAALAGASSLVDSMGRALHGGPRTRPVHSRSELVQELRSFLSAGRWSFAPLEARRIRVEDPNQAAVAAAPPPPEREVTVTWFEVKLLDEVGEALDGVEVVFSFAGRRETKTTDGSGKARIDDGEGGFCSLYFQDEKALREKLRLRWEKVREKDWFKPPEGQEASHTLVQAHTDADFVSPTLAAEEPHTVVFQPRVFQALLTGMWFETSKSFLLPTARHSLHRLKELYDRHPNSDLLVVGHADRAGQPSYNDPLSLERAQSVADYLTDRVDAWYTWYGSGKPSEKRWGKPEDVLMIEAVAEDNGETIPADTDGVRWFQETRGLAVDGIAGEQTRKALIQEYMALDGTTLPADIRMTVHGCGENFPLEPTADGEEEQINRRVEIFFFENPARLPKRVDAILPPPPGPNSKASDKQYSEWIRRTQETYELGAGRWLRLLVRYDDGTPAKNVNVTVKYSDEEVVAPTNARGVLMIHGVKGDTWSLLEIQGGSEVVSLA
jgi:outer membrane protein OmpA-like peptidoglycan-associated protein